ncbi:sigma-70 family RNA polymerase sigma factor [Shewanella sp. NIFS-20-20]|uniref:sigma-70 family RNA polymerase sigma factor n=1 Tax=Shewanella sp. NIFS-20-20 TaxID=2853806 RepID=UPI001C4715B1|nr:sigma-70 family RNA polymerase sigma factor [Shewanella sp. NIFS-20-20]MBV7314322.1 sigma-70 family RNA polymerase sigma factor [Shewanella sp. NIFS-20-20]
MSDDKQELEHLLKLWIAAVAQHRDKQSFTHLFNFFAPKIRAFGFQRLHQQGLALDLVQETMSTVWTKAHLYNLDKGAATTWVYTIMRNQCFDMLRKVQTNREDTFGDDIWPLIDEDEHVPPAQEPQITQQLLAQLHQLPVLQRQVVQGIYLQELSQQELADRLQIPIGTVKSRLRLGLEKLKSYLENVHD